MVPIWPKNGINVKFSFLIRQTLLSSTSKNGIFINVSRHPANCLIGKTGKPLTIIENDLISALGSKVCWFQCGEREFTLFQFGVEIDIICMRWFVIEFARAKNELVCART